MTWFHPSGQTIRRETRMPDARMIRETLSQYGTARETLRKVGDGPAAFVPTVALERQPIRWDTNCFYRRLGLTTEATRLDIARAFLDLDPRQDFVRLATAAEVLLSRSKRPVYDALMLGNMWAQDPDLVQRVIEGTLTGVQNEWAVYADFDVTDGEARKVDPRWRWMLSDALAPIFATYPHPPLIAIGVTRRRHPRWEQAGFVVVWMTRLDLVPTPEYVHLAADELMRTARIQPV